MQTIEMFLIEEGFTVEEAKEIIAELLQDNGAD